MRGSVQIYLMSLPDRVDPETERTLAGRLSRAEQDRFGQIKSYPRKWQFLFGHLLLARAMAGYKSLSHSGDVVAVACSDFPVGIDIEKMETRKNLDAIARRVFSKGDVQKYEKLKGEKRLRRFYELWTLHEALLKGGGKQGEKGWQTFCSEPKEGYAMTVVAKTTETISPEVKWVTVEEIKQVGAPLAAPQEKGRASPAPTDRWRV